MREQPHQQPRRFLGVCLPKPGLHRLGGLLVPPVTILQIQPLQPRNQLRRKQLDKLRLQPTAVVVKPACREVRVNPRRRRTNQRVPKLRDDLPGEGLCALHGYCPSFKLPMILVSADSTASVIA